jgi:hypothetical protein
MGVVFGGSGKGVSWVVFDSELVRAYWGEKQAESGRSSALSLPQGLGRSCWSPGLGVAQLSCPKLRTLHGLVLVDPPGMGGGLE